MNFQSPSIKLFFVCYQFCWKTTVAFCILLNKVFRFPNWQIQERLHIPKETSPHPHIWFHCASLGEAKGLLGILSKTPIKHNILLTTSTLTGKEFLEQNLKENISLVRLAPPDESKLLTQFIQQYQVISFLTYEMELWPNILRVCHQNNILTYWLAARWTRAAHFRYKLFYSLTKTCIDTFQSIYPASQYDTLQLQNHFSLPTIQPTPFDGKFSFYHQLYAHIEDVQKPQPTLALLSIHYKELCYFKPFLKSLKKTYRLLIFPRNPSEFSKIQDLLHSHQIVPYSQNYNGYHLWFDTFGMVSTWLPQCTHTFVGGSLIPKGGHNFWEPWLSRCFIWHGPHIFNQTGIVEHLSRHKMTCEIQSPKQLATECPNPPPKTQWQSCFHELLSQTQHASSHLCHNLNLLL